MEQSKEDGDAMQSALTSIASTRAEWLKWSSPLLWRNQICFQFRKIQLRLRWNWMPTRNILHLFQTYRSNSCMIETSHCPSYKFAMGGCQQNILTYSAIRALGGATKDWFAENPTLCMSSVSEVTVDLSQSEFWCSRPSKEIATVNISLQLWKQYKRLSLLVETDIIRDQRGIIDVGAVLAPVFRILSGSIFLAISSFWWGCGYLLIIGPSHWRGDTHQTVREF